MKFVRAFNAVVVPALPALVILLSSCCSNPGQQSKPDEHPPPSRDAPKLLESDCFPGVHVRALPMTQEEIFSVSMNFPDSVPTYTTDNYPWLRFDPKDPRKWRAYMWAVLKYAYDGNIAFDWRSEKSKSRWFHAPWMHRRYRWDTTGDSLRDSSGYGGREWVHGMTVERPGELSELDTALHDDTTPTQTWAVSLYNEAGGYALGRAWRNLCSGKNTETVLFPPGTVAIKLLFTTADPQKVTYLRDGPEWEANIDSASPDKRTRLHLLQIDIAVRDPRVDDATGWVFGTFMTRGDLPINTSVWGDTVSVDPNILRWCRVRPLGLAWGNDTAAAMADPPVPATRDQFIDLGLSGRVRKQLGWMGRLNGPADNPNASCVGCHGLAQRPSDGTKTFASASSPFITKRPDTLGMYFRTNRKTNVAQASGYISLDYSLQLQTGIANYWNYRKHLAKLQRAHRDSNDAARDRTSQPFNSIDR